ncbi:MAG: type II secretion system protein GspL [Pseudohongiella sp.]|nr:type II secretion system protein GspL [Pseudohongiella sp.]
MNKASTLLRIRIALSAEPQRCEWALLGPDYLLSSGEDALTDLPAHRDRIELILHANDVLITQLQLPDNARYQSDTLLSYAVEDIAAGDPQSNQVSWLGADEAGNHTLAVLDKQALQRWRGALAAVNIRNFDLRCESLLLPREEGTWSLAWAGTDGFVRSSDLNGWATDCGDPHCPPLSLSLALLSSVDSPPPTAIKLYTTAKSARPDLAAWSELLGVPVIDSGEWDWRSPLTLTGPCLSQQRPRWDVFNGLWPRLRPAMWLLVCALLLQGAATGVDQFLLNAEQRALRAQMDARFRSVFPDAVAVINPALQMQRQLTTFRQQNGISDHSDFLPMLQQLAQATEQLPAGLLRTVSWESGRMTIEFVGMTESDGLTVQTRLQQAGLRVDVAPGNSAWVFIISPA